MLWYPTQAKERLEWGTQPWVREEETADPLFLSRSHITNVEVMNQSTLCHPERRRGTCSSPQPATNSPSETFSPCQNPPHKPHSTSWSFPFWATSGLLASGLLYLRGFRRIRRTRPHLFPSWRALCFLGGLLSLYIAIGSPIDALDDVLLSAHMTQHLIFMSVAPPLLLLGAPAVPFLRSLPRGLLRGVLGPLFRMAVVAPAIPHPHPSRLRLAGNEYRLSRLAYSRGLRTGGALRCLAYGGTRSASSSPDYFSGFL